MCGSKVQITRCDAKIWPKNKWECEARIRKLCASSRFGHQVFVLDIHNPPSNRRVNLMCRCLPVNLLPPASLSIVATQSPRSLTQVLCKEPILPTSSNNVTMVVQTMPSFLVASDSIVLKSTAHHLLKPKSASIVNDIGSLSVLVSTTDL